jgi:hypothetical protein
MSSKCITNSNSSVQSTELKVSIPSSSSLAELYNHSPDLQYLGRALSSTVDFSIVLFFVVVIRKATFLQKCFLKDRNKSELFL